VKSVFLPTIRQWLDTYVSRFVSANGRAREMLELKREHSLLTAEHCRDIAEALGWSAHDVRVAEALGLLHDAGRFPQFAEYGTFVDARSVDHGVRGAEEVVRAGILDALDGRDRARILDCILLHNRRIIPPDAPADSLPFLRLVRDADKLDIYRIAVERLDSGRFAGHLKEALGIIALGPATPEAVGDVLGRRSVANEHIRTGEDFLLMQLSWVFDISYGPTLKRIVEHGYLERIARSLVDDDARSASIFLLAEANTMSVNGS
jgi:hypothetical protein